MDVLANDTPSTGHTWEPTTLVITPPREVALTADVDSGLVLVSPQEGFTGLASIGYVVTDSSGQTATATLTVVVPGEDGTTPVPLPTPLPGPGDPTVAPDPSLPPSPVAGEPDSEQRSLFAVVGSFFPWLLLLLLLAAIAYYLYRRYRADHMPQ